MNKISLVFYVIGEVKTGKSHLAMLGLSGDGSDTVMIDATAAGHAKLAAMNVYGDEFEKRYFHVEESKDAILKVVKGIEDDRIKTICIDESKNFRDAFANPVLEKINEERAKDKKSTIRTIYPVTRWSDVYKDVDDMFREYDGKYNFIITGGLKEKRVFDKESKMNVMTGGKESDGLRTLKTLADVGLMVITTEKSEGSPPKIARSRTVKVKINRLLDYASDKWVDEIKDIGELIDKVVENSKFERDMFLV